ncbi:hypothetical protein LJ655_25685 [Paraburkholderia sp. MMS20-SJTN17]|uniref:DUF3618 domain-containing protein n=1 Tax=Paraburkholderia translucens TaxID=2886945 RepID=A0ABS8KKD4_9BURK|nr:hypothetical protein [Paraburkholderia sp. MMS20-SJTN17]MCC8405226.1 hypothetical protein [Paraburkholderia sp. MMS20-SJTN17]
MGTEKQKKLSKIHQVNLDNLVKLQAQTTRLINETAATNQWTRRWEPWLMAAACLAVGSAIVAAGAVLGKLLGH